MWKNTEAAKSMSEVALWKNKVTNVSKLNCLEQDITYTKGIHHVNIIWNRTERQGKIFTMMENNVFELQK